MSWHCSHTADIHPLAGNALPVLLQSKAPFRGPCEHVVFLCSSLFAVIWSWNPTFWQMFQNFLNPVFHATHSKFHDFLSKWCNTRHLYNPKSVMKRTLNPLPAPNSSIIAHSYVSLPIHGLICKQLLKYQTWYLSKKQQQKTTRPELQAKQNATKMLVICNYFQFTIKQWRYINISLISVLFVEISVKV